MSPHRTTNNHAAGGHLVTDARGREAGLACPQASTAALGWWRRTFGPFSYCLSRPSSGMMLAAIEMFLSH